MAVDVVGQIERVQPIHTDEQNMPYVMPGFERVILRIGLGADAAQQSEGHAGGQQFLQHGNLP